MKTRDLRKLIKQQGGWDLVRQYAAAGNLPLAAGQLLLLGTKEKALEILRLSAQYRVKEKLARQYRKELDHLVKLHKDAGEKEKMKSSNEDDQPYVWFCWLQGLAEAPQVVRNCYKSALAAYAGKGKVTLITADNYRDYVTFPQEIQAKIKRGIIAGAHLADLIRLELLINYGGIWTDATVFYSGALPDFLLKNRLFAYQIVKPGRDGQAIPMSNWLLVAPKRNRLLLITRDLLYAYWRKHDKLLDYYIFHIFFQLAAEACPGDWAEVIPVDSGAPHLLGQRLFDQFEPDFWQAIKEQTSIHKLSYKFPPGMFLQKGTYFAQVVAQGGKNG